jgi:surfeit locus 1 family protein
VLPAVIVGVVILVGLGVWQVERLHEKTDLLERIAALQTAPPEPLGVVLNRLGDKVSVDYTHVVFTCPTLETSKFVRLYAVSDDGPGDRIITACPLPVGGPFRSILVDRGFLNAGESPGARGPLVSDPVVGVLIKGSKTGMPRAASGEFFSRDIPAIAADLGAEGPAPVFFMLESPEPKAGGPRPAPVPTNISNSHLGYAITWFGMAIALIAVYVASLRARRRS